MVLCEINSNLILVELIKNRMLGVMCRAYSILMQCGIKLKKHILDNEASDEV